MLFEALFRIRADVVPVVLGTKVVYILLIEADAKQIRHYHAKRHPV
jgi:hypothetical protein